jgi:hypothetical protein
MCQKATTSIAFRRDAVVEMVVDAAEVNTPDTRESCVAGKRANARLAPNKRKSPLDLVSDGSRSCNSIELPPIRGFVDFRGSATSDADREQFDLSAIAQPGEEIFSGDRVAALRLVDCLKQRILQFGRRLKQLITFPGKDRDGRALGKICPIEDNFSADNFLIMTENKASIIHWSYV